MTGPFQFVTPYVNPPIEPTALVYIISSGPSDGHTNLYDLGCLVQPSNTNICGAGGAAPDPAATNTIFIGPNCGSSNTIGNGNIAIGNLALSSQTAGDNCIGIGAGALQNTTTGDSATAFGGGALSGLTTASSCTGIGLNAGRSITTENFNTIIGAQADIVAGAIWSVAIGYGTVVRGSKQAVLGSSGGNGFAIGFGGTTEPPDADLPNEFIFLWIDSSAIAPLLKLKMRDNAGTIRTASIVLT